jgi:solute carrier family 35 protein C2
MGDCVVEDGHGHHHSEEAEAVEGTVPLTVAVELDERGESREDGGGQRKKVGGIRREPSFSRWCRDPSVAAASNTAAAAATRDSDDSEEFELPLLPSSSGGGSSPMDIEAGATARSDDLPISPRLLAKVIGLIACWYTLSTCLTL